MKSDRHGDEELGFQTVTPHSSSFFHPLCQYFDIGNRDRTSCANFHPSTPHTHNHSVPAHDVQQGQYALCVLPVKHLRHAGFAHLAEGGARLTVLEEQFMWYRLGGAQDLQGRGKGTGMKERCIRDDRGVRC